MVELVERDPNKNMIIAATLALSGYGIGYYVSIMNSMGTPLLVGVYHLNEEERLSALGNLTFLFPVGAMIGVLLCGKIMDYYGRKFLVTYIDLAAIFVIAIHLIENLYILLIARFLMGFVSTLYALPATIMMVECLPRKVSALGNIIVYSVVTFSLLGTFIQQLLFSYDTLVKHWRVFLCYPAIIAAVRFTVLYLYLDFESPNWLILKKAGDPSLRTAVKDSLRSIYVEDGLDAKVDEIMREKEAAGATKEVTYSDIFTQKYRSALISALIIMIGQQVSGINFLVFFSTELFDRISGNGKTISFIFGLGNFLGSFVCMYFINKYSRLSLLKYGVLIQGLSLILIPVGIVLRMYFILPLFILTYILSYAVGMGATCGLYCNEILPPVAVGFVNAMNWVGAALVGKLGPIGNQMIGSNGMLIFFAIWCFIVYYLTDKVCIESTGSVVTADAEVKDGQTRELEVKLVERE